MTLDRRTFVALLAASGLSAREAAAQELVVPDARLRRIKMATIAGADLAAIEHWYAGALEYRVDTRGKISPALAASWGTPAMAGRAFITMVPKNGGDVPIRAVAIDPITPPRPLTSWGWSAIEIALQDVDAVYAKLKSGWLNSPIKLLGEPHPLRPDSPIHAMQLMGPAGEVLYLTANLGDRAKMNHPEPKSSVDRPFIAVLAGPDLAKLKAFYREGFALGDQGDTSQPVATRATAHGLPADHVYTISVAVCAERGNKIELDGFPPEATAPQPRNPGQLPPGTAIMSFSVRNFDNLPARTLTPPTALYGDVKAATFQGPAGELTELIADRM